MNETNLFNPPDRDLIARMKRAYAECPGAVGGTMPEREGQVGYILIEPGCINTAMEYLKRRFHVNREAGIESTGELRVDIIPRSRKGGARRARRLFKKPEQFEFTLTGSLSSNSVRPASLLAEHATRP